MNLESSRDLVEQTIETIPEMTDSELFKLKDQIYQILILLRKEECFREETRMSTVIPTTDSAEPKGQVSSNTQ
jgi:hypothetical protein